jgi:hypothetical protein
MKIRLPRLQQILGEGAILPSIAGNVKTHLKLAIVHLDQVQLGRREHSRRDIDELGDRRPAACVERKRAVKPQLHLVVCAEIESVAFRELHGRGRQGT